MSTAIIPLDELVEATGVTQVSVITGIRSAVRCGVLVRRKVGHTYRYMLQEGVRKVQNEQENQNAVSESI